MTEQFPETTVVRVSRGSFEQSRLAEVEAANMRTSEYLIPAIEALPGLLHYYAGVSSAGSFVHVSLWDSEEHADQMGRLKEMVVDAREEFLAVGVEFTPIINYPLTWTV